MLFFCLGEPPDIVQLLRDFSKHESSNIKDKEIEKLKAEIKTLTEKCEDICLSSGKQSDEVVVGNVALKESPKNKYNTESNVIERNDLDSTNVFDDTIGEHDNISDIIEKLDVSSDSILSLEEKLPVLSNSEAPTKNESLIVNTSLELNSDKKSEDGYIDESTNSTNSAEYILGDTDSVDAIFNKGLSNLPKDPENETSELQISNKLLPEQFLKILYGDACKKGVSRLSQQVSVEEDLQPIQVITNSLPNIIPNILLSKREEVIPLILCAVRYHNESKIRDELLSMLFNLIKRPDVEQRRIIIDGCLSFANKVDSSRIECELLPQCWEQINHKYHERRLLVSETCGSLSPCTSPDLLSSLVFSMLSQMLEEERNEEVRISVIQNLSVILTYMIESEKYMHAFKILDRSLNDSVPEVIIETKKSLLPVLGMWSLKNGKFQSHFVPQLLGKCSESLQRWHETSISYIEGESEAVLTATAAKFHTYIDCLTSSTTLMLTFFLLSSQFSNDLETVVSSDESRIPLMQNPLLNLDSLIGDKDQVKDMIIKFDTYFQNSSSSECTEIDWICKECILKVCEMSGQVMSNYSFIEKMVDYMVTVCRVFGKEFTSSRIVPFFESCMRNMEAAFLRDIPPVCSPLLVMFLCGVLACFDDEEHIKKLITFVKQCLLTISTQGLSKEFLIYSITILCRNNPIQVALLNMLRETLVYPVSEVKMVTGVIFEVLVKNVEKDKISTQLTPAIITLTNDRDINVVVSAVPALGSVIESISDKSLMDKIVLQIQTLLDDVEYQQSVVLQKTIIKTFSKIVPNLETRVRDEFFIPRLKIIAESNPSLPDITDRLEVAEEIIAALSASLCCFLQKDIISNFIIPTLKLLESELKDISPETVDIVRLLLKDTENKVDDDQTSIGAVSNSSKKFSGISSRFDLFKKKGRERSNTNSSN